MQSSGQITGVSLLRKSPFEQSVLSFFFLIEEEKRGFCRITFEVAANRTSGLINLVFSCQTGTRVSAFAY